MAVVPFSLSRRCGRRPRCCLLSSPAEIGVTLHRARCFPAGTDVTGCGWGCRLLVRTYAEAARYRI